MKQRVAMAIATSLEPRVIVADEPTSALDVVVQRRIMETLGRLQAGLGAAVVLIGHDMGLVAQFADYVGVMYAGRLVDLGSGGGCIRQSPPPIHKVAHKQSAEPGTPVRRTGRYSRPASGPT